MELEQKRMPISTGKKFTDERLQAEKKQVENKEKVIDMKEKDKLALKFTYSKLDKNILKWTELLVAFEATIHNSKGLHLVDKFNYLKNQFYRNTGEVTSGLELAKDNYYVAIDLLKKRHGKNKS